mgnify:CR=1 FL=1
MYTFDSRIRYSESDSEGVLTDTALVDYFQDCSSMQSDDLGIGSDYLREHRIGWVVNFWQIDIMRMPRLSERVVTGTSPYELKGMLGLRNFLMTTKEGETLAVANSVWTMIDMEKLRPIKVPEEIMDKYEVFPKFDMEYAGRKLVLPDVTPEETGETMVREYQIDTNGHMNNAWYLRLSRGALPDRFNGRREKRLLIEYKKMAFLGDPLRIVRYDEADTVTVVLSDKEGKTCAIVRFVYEA